MNHHPETRSTRNRRRIAALCLGALVVLLFVCPACLAQGGDAYFALRARLTTTSDWTSVSIYGATVGALLEQVEATGAQDLRVSGDQGLNISKKQFDATRVVASFALMLADLQAPQLTLEIRKGNLGSTTLELFSGDPERLAGSFASSTNVPGDSTNLHTYPIAAATVQAGGVRAFPPVSYQPKVLAFYYPWYGAPDGPSGRWVHWSPSAPNYSSAHTPLAGHYDSQDPATIERHIRQARRAGVDAFIASWWGIGSFEDRALERLVQVAEQMAFSVTVYYERASSRDQVVQEVRYIISRYAASPAFLRVGGKPVVFFYTRVTAAFSKDDWEWVFQQLDGQENAIFAVADGFRDDLITGFAGVHTYNPVSDAPEKLRSMYRSNALRAKAVGKLFAATVVPGYDDRNVRQPGFAREREDGAYYRSTWDIAASVRPHWMLVTSFNEWHEGSEIEPSVEFGNRYLDLTRELAQKWKGCRDMEVPEKPTARGGGL